MLPPAPESGDTSRPPLGGDRRQRQVRAAETRLLYENASTGIAVTVVIASLLAYAQWDVVPRFIVVGLAALRAAGLRGEIRARAPVLARVAERHRATADGMSAFVVGDRDWRQQVGVRPRSCSTRQPDR